MSCVCVSPVPDVSRPCGGVVLFPRLTVPVCQVPCGLPPCLIWPQSDFCSLCFPVGAASVLFVPGTCEKPCGVPMRCGPCVVWLLHLAWFAWCGVSVSFGFPLLGGWQFGTCVVWSPCRALPVCFHFVVGSLCDVVSAAALPGVVRTRGLVCMWLGQVWYVVSTGCGPYGVL